MRWLVLVALAGLLGSCGDRNKLPERHARATAEGLIASSGPRLRDFHHIQWKEFRQVSPTEAYGTAALVYRFALPNGGTGQEVIPGKFVYRKLPDTGWTLVSIDFPNPNSLYHNLSEQVLVKVGSASVAMKGVRVTEPEPARDSRTGDSLAPGAADTAAGASGASPALPKASALSAARTYLGSQSVNGERWRANTFSQAIIDGELARIPAILVIDDPQGTRKYQGVFRYAFDPASGRWALVGMSFGAEDLDSIKREIQPPLVLQ